ncbi:MAG TPA: hypothetical protein VGO93_07135 [Candidatus Xenobia bacterium]|jgi:hypothetical protein
MGKWSNFLGQGLLVGSLACMLSGAACAQAPIDTTTTTTTTSTTAVVPLGGYYDSNGIFHSGMNPYSGGFYDQTGVWHVGTAYASTAYTSTTYVAPMSPDRYNSFHYNYYAGYGAMYELNRGFTYVIGPDGLKHQVDLNNNRTLVRLTDDNTLEPRLDVARGFDRGLIEVPQSSFDPMRLDIPTGRTVTFYADPTLVGTHTVDPMDGHSFNQSIIITPNQVFSWTFTEPGLYRFDDSFGGGPTGSHRHGLIIRVHGSPVAFDDSAFVDADYIQTASMTTTAVAPVQTFNTVTTTTMPETTAVQQTIQVQGQKTVAPLKKVHKTVLRNHELK